MGDAQNTTTETQPNRRKIIIAAVAVAAVLLVGGGIWAFTLNGGDAASKNSAGDLSSSGPEAASAQSLDEGASMEMAQANDGAKNEQSESVTPDTKPADASTEFTRESSNRAATGGSATGESAVYSYPVTSVETWETHEPSTATQAAEPAQPSTVSVRVVINGTYANGGTRVADVTLTGGSTAFDALLASGAAVNAQPTVDGVHVIAIDGLAEMMNGPLSGWEFDVNGVSNSESCSKYVIADGDILTWIYVGVSG